MIWYPLTDFLSKGFLVKFLTKTCVSGTQYLLRFQMSARRGPAHGATLIVNVKPAKNGKNYSKDQDITKQNPYNTNPGKGDKLQKCSTPLSPSCRTMNV